MSSRDASQKAQKSTSGATDRPPAVHVQFAPSQGRRLRRSEPSTCGDGVPLWTERPLLMERADGHFDLIGISENLDGLARWILSFGANAEVQGPARLERRVAAEARRVLQFYESD